MGRRNGYFPRLKERLSEEKGEKLYPRGGFERSNPAEEKKKTAKGEGIGSSTYLKKGGGTQKKNSAQGKRHSG